MILETDHSRFKVPRGAWWWIPLRIVAAVVLLAVPSRAGAQALAVGSGGTNTQLVVVSQPLADATAACWPGIGEASPEPQCVSGGRVGFSAAMSAAMAEVVAAPLVIVAVGAATLDEMTGQVVQPLAGLPSAPRATAVAARVHDGAITRRLGRPGSEALIRLQVTLPSAGDPDRSAAEVLWTLIPDVVGQDFEALTLTLGFDMATLEFRADADLADVELSRARLALARLAGDPDLDAEQVAEAAQRIRIQRLASLEEVEAAAADLVKRWLADGEAGVRQMVFGAEAVSLDDVQHVARTWLARHPGEAEITIPPRVFNPRFAPGPQIANLDNNLSVAILERPGANLSALVLRPVLFNDLTGDAASQVLARVASRIRSLPNPPPVVAIALNPPRIEMAGPADGFDGLAEALQAGLDGLQDDTAPVETPDSPRTRALSLLAGQLGLAAVNRTTAAEVLQPANLAVGGVAGDADSALEAMRKLGVGGEGNSEKSVVSQISGGNLKTRQAISGPRSALAALVELPADSIHAAAMTGLLKTRLENTLPNAAVEVLRPLVPGRRVVLVVIERDGGLEELEKAVEEVWKGLAAPPGEVEIAEVRRELAAAASADSGGVMGRARLCAGVAAGDRAWRAPVETEMTLLLLDAEQLAAPMGMITPWGQTLTTGAGRLPILQP